MEPNALYYGDNLPILREHFLDESVDLIYLDPPFNSKRSYNVLFKEMSTASSPAQIEAFEDTWHWGDSAQQAFEEVALHGSDDTARLLKATVDALGHNDVTAYLSMMAVRLIELQRVLKPTGSIYLHCDPTASHYLKVLMDSIFGARNFRNEIIWKRTTAHSDSRAQFSRVTDTILFYARSNEAKWVPQFEPHSKSYLKSHYRHLDAEGRTYRLDNIIRSRSMGPRPNLAYEYKDFTPPFGWRMVREKLEAIDREGRLYWSKKKTPYLVRYLDEQSGEILDNLWSDIPPVNSMAKERLGYPTQKPQELLERIISASSSTGDVVLDPFCGCGTAMHAAHKLGRSWIGIDITHLAIGLVRRRMEDAFPELKAKINVIGEPVDLPGATELAARDPYQFQWWALDRIGAQPAGSGVRKKGMDRGIDGVIPFIEGSTDRRRVIVSVKAGKLSPAFVRDLKGVLEREGEPIGVLVTLNAPTREMKTEAAAAGSYHSERWGRDYARIQIITAQELIAERRVDMPPQVSPFAQAPRETERGEQTTMI